MKLRKGLINQINFGNCSMFAFQKIKKCLVYEVECINDPCLVTLAVNPKEYYEYFKSENINKKHKGVKKGSSAMEYENYAERIKPLYEFDSFKKSKKDMKKVVRISVKKGEMTSFFSISLFSFFVSVNKRFFINNKIYAPLGH